ncbi:6-hydroxymethylpterin diphosphokinase MptE-like protein [Clostridium uliginosum]|uniref:Uncharacterized conserved protein n=1 Tax=Clostridium uliginosum TaxID=119641 RepID=A0A1I1KIY6_9CLOT|nr:6-hydroxymethylpterin diphosphokinase MptE-like protein [Clostridium uliginosum]SFC60739.1 Uncharacterized conserved protein [Clostridium uliginosum]
MLNKNLIILKEYYQDLYEKISKQENQNNLQEVKSKNGMINLLVDDEIWLHSRYNPENEALKWINNINVKDEDTILVVGLGLAYYLDNLVEKYKEKKLIIIEPNIDIFKKMLKFKNITEYLKSENIVFIVGISPYIIRMLISDYLSENKIKKVHIAEMSIYKKINNQYIKEMYEEIDKGLFNLKANIATEIAFSEMWLNNTVRLLDCIKEIPNVNVMKEEFKNIPVVIVSAGPSLNKNAEYLKEIYNKALIIAVGSAVNILEKKGITPHIIMGLDGQEMEAKLFQSLKNNDSIFVFGSSVHYKAVECYKGLKMSLVLNNDITMIELYKRLGLGIDTFSSGPSVSNIALVLAHYLQSPHILLIGQDLAYTDNNRYADGGIHNHNIIDEKLGEKKGYEKKIDIYGNEVYTKHDLIGIKNWFDDYIKIFDKDIDVCNCSEAGLGIEGVPNISFKEAINKFCTNEFDIYEKLVSLSNKGNSIEKDKFNDLISRYKDEIEELIKLSKKRLDKTYNLKRKSKNENFSSELRKIFELCDEIENFETFNVFIGPTGRLYIDTVTISTDRKLDKLNNIDDKNKAIINGLILQYEYVHKCLKIVKFAFEKKDIEYTS